MSSQMSRHTSVSAQSDIIDLTSDTDSDTNVNDFFASSSSLPTYLPASRRGVSNKGPNASTSTTSTKFARNASAPSASASTSAARTNVAAGSRATASGSNLARTSSLLDALDAHLFERYGPGSKALLDSSDSDSDLDLKIPLGTLGKDMHMSETDTPGTSTTASPAKSKPRPVPKSKPRPVPKSKPRPVPKSKPRPVPKSKPRPVPKSKPTVNKSGGAGGKSVRASSFALDDDSDDDLGLGSGLRTRDRTPRRSRARTEASSDEDEDTKPVAKKRKTGAGSATTARAGSGSGSGAGKSKAMTAEAKAAKLLEKAQAKAEALLQKEAEKKRKAEMGSINKLIAKKEDHIKDFTLCASGALRDTVLMDKLTSHLAPYGCQTRFLDRESEAAGDIGLIRWQRRVDRRYDEHEHMWMPVDPPYTRFEATNMIYMHAKELLSLTSASSRSTRTLIDLSPLHTRIQHLKSSLRLTNKHQIFLMINDLEAHYRKRGKGSRAANAEARQQGVEQVTKPALERALAEFQVKERCFVVHVEGLEDAAEWVYNMTADIGVRPHKLIERSHLPFCPVTTIGSGSGRDSADTYQKMLEQINSVTTGRGEAIRSLRPTLRSLFAAYEEEEDVDARAEMLMDAVVDYKADGSRSGKILNIGLSSKVAAIFWSYDSLTRIS